MGDEVFQDPKICMKKKTELFDNYNQTVDVVSAYEYFFTNPYSANVTYFDRFPKNKDTDDTPDFTVLFNENYGLVGEICRSLPPNDDQFMDELKQLKKYEEFPFKKNHDDYIKPKNHDILLSLSPSDSDETINKIKEKIEEGVIEFNKDIIFMEHIPKYEDRNPKYILRKFPGYNNLFKKTCDIREESLEYHLDEQRKPLNITINKLKRYKVSGLICNDVPPDVYFVVQLWLHVFYHCLTKEQRIQYKEKRDKKGIPLKLRVGDLTRDLNSKYIPRANVKPNWVKNVFDFLIKTGDAVKKAEGIYEIKYRNIIEREIRKREVEIYQKNGEEDEEKLQVLNRYFITKYCENMFGETQGKRKPEVQDSSEKKPTHLENYGFKVN